METGSRRRYGSWPFGKNRLIPLTVLSFVLALDVGRQGNMSKQFDMFCDRLIVPAKQSHRAQAQFSSANDLCFQFPIAKNHSLAYRQFSPGRTSASQVSGLIILV